MVIVNKDEILIPNCNGIPKELINLNQWVLWRAEKIPEKNEFAKIPYQANGVDKAKINDKTTWGSFEAINQAYQAGKSDGIGVVITKEDPYTCIDIDNVDMDNLTEKVKEIINLSYAELSPSRKGIHVWVKSTHNKEKVMNKNAELNLEVYDNKRFMTMTGENINNLAINEGKHITKFIENTFRRNIQPHEIMEPIETGELLSDEVVLQKMFKSVKGEKIKKLFFGDISDYGNDHSSADLGLCSYLAFFSNNQLEQIQRLFERSALNRDKWINRPDYRAKTLNKALSRPQVSETKDFEDVATERKFYGLNDLGNAKRLVDEYGEEIKYSHRQASWLIWDGSRWAYDQQEQILLLAQNIPGNIRRDASKIEDDNERKKMYNFATSSENIGRLKDMVKTARFQTPTRVDMDELDKDIYLFNVANGTLNLKAGKLQPHNKKDLITKKSPIIYVPDAKCEEWNKFLHKVMGGDQELIKYLQRILGYALTGDTSEQKFFFLYGGGRNGKSTFLEVVGYIIGEYADTTPMSTFIQQQNEGVSNDIAALKGSRFVSAQETEIGRVFAESKIKQLTGGDTIKARFLHKEYFEFTPQFKIFLAGNHKPIINETKEAIWNRIRLIPFTVRIEDHERDPRLKEKLMAEASGILNWMLEGCEEWKENGLQCPSGVTSATEEYREEMDGVQRFLNIVSASTH
ncbi:phage/plasmid primase, P4 family [Bacillus sp. Cr_A10]|uniref:phage/plasmid primase, P4 family n=1 Tax=Bacillus sp. Cr_A10 TaxID=3033993 RepID=UPI0023DC6DD6|nr:phage/plasmid primase, P4 family [Bacillus sp. Cr_A10]MDF2064968.1 phage/plasmid primase, P4 family [Bacillus sp. Cr_A10]